MRRCGVMAFVSLCLLLSLPGWAATERYDYDALGRLVRYTNAQGQVIEYVYDAAGNILQVKDGGAAIPPAITGVSPDFIRRSQRNSVRFSGTGLAGSGIRSVDPALSVSEVVASSTTIDFNVDVPSDAALGPRTFEVSHSSGVASATLQVVPALAFAVYPSPIALLPDGVDHKYTLVASEPTPFAQNFSLWSANPAILRIATTAIALPAGALQADVLLAGLSPGATQLLVSAPGAFEATAIDALVGADALAANVTRSAVVGLAKGSPTVTPPVGTTSWAVAPSVGIAKGDATITPPVGTASTANAPTVGLVKGDGTITPPAGTSAVAFSATVGLVKGDATSPPPGVQLGDVVARPVGVTWP